LIGIILKMIVKDIFRRFFWRNETIKGASDFESEDSYYKYLFTENKLWNSSEPNRDEQARWNVIRDHLQFIRGYLTCLEKKGDLRILDIGSGRGWLSQKLSAFGEVVGIEPVDAVVKHAKKLFPNLHFLSGTLQDHENYLKEAKLNLVVCSEVIEHIPDDAKDFFCRGINKILDESGFLIITTPRREVQKMWVELYGDPSQPIESWLSTDDLAGILKRNGFRPLNYKGIKLEHLAKGQDIEIYQSWIFIKSQVNFDCR